jgi:hypothetical protein
MCARIEKGDEALKHRLPVWTPSCAEFRDNHRAAADAVKPLPRLMMDFDEKGHTDDILSKLKIENGKLKIGCAEPDLHGMVVLLIEESARRGTHVLVELPAGMDAETAQQLMKEATGFEPDKQVKGVDRCIYMVPEDYTRYVNEKLFEVVEVVEGDTQGTVPQCSVNCAQQGQSPCVAEVTERRYPQEFKGVPYTSIISEYWRRTGGEPSEGERNKRLHQLAANLRAICDNNEEWLLEVMPKFGLSAQEMRGIIHSACKEPTKGSRLMDQIVDDLWRSFLPLSRGSQRGSEQSDVLEDWFEADQTTPNPSYSGGEVPKAIYKNLPIGLKESLAGVPVTMHMPVLCSVMPIAAAYADQVTVEYCDGNVHRLGLMSIIRGEQASNKSVCKNAVDLWKHQLDEEDALARKREEEWKERKKGRKANEKAPEDPHVLIRVVPVTVSCSTLLKRFKNAQGHTIYSFGEELDTLRKTNGAGSWSSKYDIYRLSFDFGEWGQDYNSDQAESGVVNVAYNWTMLGTYGAMRKCFKSDNIENGLSSRILVAEMPDSSFQKMPKFGKRSAEDEAKIQEAVTRLRSYSGLVDTPRLRKAIEEWVEQKRVEAAKDIDHVKDTYRKRAAVIGFRCGVIFHLLSAKDKETKPCLEFALMMAEYCLSQQIKTFGEALQSQYVDAQDVCQRYGANHSVFDQLAPVFTVDDLRALKRGFCSDVSLRKIISRWMRDGWIEKTDQKHWNKVKSEK